MRKVIFLLFLAFSSIAMGNNKTLFPPFEFLDLGLSSAKKALQDSKGQLWIGTSTGLKLIVNRNQIDLPANLYQLLGKSYIWDIQEDEEQNIWFLTTANGVVKYNLVNQKVHHYSVSENSFNEKIRWIQISKNKEIYITSANSLYRALPSSSTFEKIDLNIGNNLILNIYVDKHISISLGKTVKLYDLELNLIQSFQFESKIRRVLEVDSKLYFLSTEDYFIFDMNTSKPPVKFPFSDKTIDCVGSINSSEIIDNYIWFSNYRGAFCKLDTKTNLLTQFTGSVFHLDPPHSQIHSIAKDNNGGILLATSTGVYSLPPLSNYLTVRKTQNTRTVSIIKLNDKPFLLASDGLYTLKDFQVEDKVYTFSRVFYHVKTQSGHYVLEHHAWGNKLYFVSYDDQLRVEEIKSSRKIDSILGFNGKYLYAKSGNKDFYFEPNTDKWVPTTSEDLSISKLVVVTEFSETNGFIGCDYDGYLVIYKDKSLSKVRPQSNKDNADNDCIAVATIDESTVIVNTKWRTFLFNLSSRTFEFLTENLNNANKISVYKNNLVFFEDNSIASFNIKNKESKVVKFDSGLIKKPLYFSDLIAFEDSLLIGVQNGIVKIDEQFFSQITQPPKLHSFRIYVNSKLSEQNNSGSQPDFGIQFKDSPYGKNIGIEFVKEQYYKNTDFYLRYSLDGVSWQELPKNEETLTLFDISRGKHDLKVQASNDRASWGPTTTLSFIASPPFWLSYWAFAVYALLLITIIFFAIKIRTRALEAKALDLENQVAERTRQLETLLDKKSREFANLSHEFRTPLTLVLGPIKKLLKQEKDPKKENTLTTMKRNAFRLQRMVDQILHLERFQVQQVTAKTPIHITPITKFIGESFQELAREKRVSLNIEKLDDIWLMFTPDAYEKILLNLLSNALKYTQAQDSIYLCLTIDEENGIARLIVKDTGIGIPENELEQVFERFHRVLDNHSEQITGAGIGLSLVKELVESHGGEVTVSSIQNKETCFTVNLPAIPLDQVKSILDKGQKPMDTDIIEMEIESLFEQKNTADSHFEEKKEESSNNLPSVLVVEDNHDMRRYIEDTLASNFHTLAAANGLEGLEIAKAQVPDLIISDIMMPQMDGYDFCKSIKSNEITSHIPVVLLTARSDRESRIRGWSENADEYLAKPFDEEELLIRVKNLLDIRDILRKRFGEDAFASSNSLANQAIDETQSDSEEEKLHKVYGEFLEKLNLILEESFNDPAVGIDNLAQMLNMSERQLFRKLRNTINMTPAEYLRRFRLEKSKVLLEAGKTVQFTAIEVGFNSQSYFGKCFKAQFGVSPGSYLKRSSR